MTIYEQLAAPFAQIHWRAQTLNRDGTSALALAYIDARDVMDRLDSVVGSANWRDSYVETAKGRLICNLELRIDDEWVGKSDGAGDTDEVLLDHSAGAKVQVADLAVSHLAGWEPDPESRGLQERAGAKRPETVPGWRVGQGDRVSLAFGAVSPSI